MGIRTWRKKGMGKNCSPNFNPPRMSEREREREREEEKEIEIRLY